MLRLTVGPEDYLMIGDDIKIVFLGGSKNHTRIMLDIPKELNVVRSKAVEKHAENPEKKSGAASLSCGSGFAGEISEKEGGRK